MFKAQNLTLETGDELCGVYLALVLAGNALKEQLHQTKDVRRAQEVNGQINTLETLLARLVANAKKNA